MSPFLSLKAAHRLKEFVRRMTKSGGRVDLLVGVKLSFTPPDALLFLSKIAEHDEGVRVKTDFNLEQRFHSKLYLAEWTSGSCEAVTGSANLTDTGLLGIGELCLLHNFKAEEQAWIDLTQYFAKWFEKGENVKTTLNDYNEQRTEPYSVEPSRDRSLLQRIRNGEVKFAYRDEHWTEESKTLFSKFHYTYKELGSKLPSDDINDYIGATEGSYRRGDTFVYIWHEAGPQNCLFDFYTVQAPPFPLDPSPGKSSKDGEYLIYMPGTPARVGPGFKRSRDIAERMELLLEAFDDDPFFKKRVCNDETSKLPPSDIERLFHMVFTPKP